MPLELWQAEIRETVFGAFTSRIFTGPIGGLGIPVPRAYDLDRQGDGAVGGDDPLPRRILTFPMGFEGDTAAEAWAEFRTMKQAWRKSPVDIPLGLRLPGMPEEGLLYYGRPRGFDSDLSNLKSGHAAGLLTFEALDPLGYGPLEELGPGAGPFTVDNVGDETVDVVLTVTGDGGTPEITNADDGGATILFGEPLGIGAVRVLSTKDRTNLDEYGFNVPAELSPGAQWFRLVPGENEISLSGAASLAIEFRPGYL